MKLYDALMLGGAAAIVAAVPTFFIGLGVYDSTAAGMIGLGLFGAGMVSLAVASQMEMAKAARDRGVPLHQHKLETYTGRLNMQHRQRVEQDILRSRGMLRWRRPYLWPWG